ncbi:hypothetical protein BLNAU_9119 [Blattamonas nauphoetae]|uniref:Uncharacterized protein n=1 Tax=Blattamonas nauphoetae TaxID=2049346 RepID=A0ABQ9XWV3_9EUKA|nr:hypothetical protein BLNAU_9119 [Blattamonas nauphoetae]
MRSTFSENLVSLTYTFLSVYFTLEEVHLFIPTESQRKFEKALRELVQTILTSFAEQSILLLNSSVECISSILRDFHKDTLITLTPDALASLEHIIEPLVSSALPTLQEHLDDPASALFQSWMDAISKVMIATEEDLNAFDPFVLPLFVLPVQVWNRRISLYNNRQEQQATILREEMNRPAWRKLESTLQGPHLLRTTDVQPLPSSQTEHVEISLVNSHPFDTTTLTSEELDLLESQESSSLEADSVESETLQTSLPSSQSSAHLISPSLLPVSNRISVTQQNGEDSADTPNGHGTEHEFEIEFTPQLITEPLTENDFLQDDEELIQTLLNLEFTVTHTQSLDFVPLNRNLFSHFASLLNSSNPTVRTHLFNLLVRLNDSPTHKPFLLKYTFPNVRTSFRDFTPETFGFMEIFSITTSPEDILSAYSMPNDDSDLEPSQYSLPLTDTSSIHNRSTRFDSATLSRAISLPNADLSPLLNTIDFGVFQRYFGHASHIFPNIPTDMNAPPVGTSRGHLKKELQPFVPLLSHAHHNPESFKLSFRLLHPSIQFRTFIQLIRTSLVHSVMFPQVLVEYYLDEAGKFEQFGIVVALCSHPNSIHPQFRSVFSFDVLIERVARKARERLYLIKHSIYISSRSDYSWTHRSDICVIGTVVEKKLSTIGEIDINTLQPSLHVSLPLHLLHNLQNLQTFHLDTLFRFRMGFNPRVCCLSSRTSFFEFVSQINRLLVVSER